MKTKNNVPDRVHLIYDPLSDAYIMGLGDHPDYYIIVKRANLEGVGAGYVSKAFRKAVNKAMKKWEANPD